MERDDSIIEVNDMVRLNSGRIGFVKEIYDNGLVSVYVSGGFGHLKLDAGTLIKIQMQPEPVSDAGPFCKCGEPVITKGQTCHWCTRRIMAEGRFYL